MQNNAVSLRDAAMVKKRRINILHLQISYRVKDKLQCASICILTCQLSRFYSSPSLSRSLSLHVSPFFFLLHRLHRTDRRVRYRDNSRYNIRMRNVRMTFKRQRASCGRKG